MTQAHASLQKGMRKLRARPRWLGPLLFLTSLPIIAQAASAQAPFQGKRVVGLAPVPNVQIEMPNRQIRDFGPDFQARLVTRLTESGKFIVTDANQNPEAGHSNALLAPPQYEWPGSATPAATVRIQVEALSFQTGNRGSRMFYGFNERFKTPFNDGTGRLKNEFPLKDDPSDPTWFGKTFDRKGWEPFDSRSGLDLGEGLSLNLLFAWLDLKYATYHTELHLSVEIDAPLAGKNEQRLLFVEGEGFFFDVVGGYIGYSGGLTLARSDAMAQAIQNALDGTYSAIEKSLEALPLTAKIDSILPDGTLLIGTGPNAQIAPGVRYELLESPERVEIEVGSSNLHGALGRVVSGDPQLAHAGMFLREASSVSSESARLSSRSSSALQTEKITLPWKNLAQSNLDGLIPKQDDWKAYLKSLIETATLAYRLWRYSQYDQALHKFTDPSGIIHEFWKQPSSHSWAHRIGLTQAQAVPQTRPVVAILDTGVDYNHPLLRPSLWLNPSPRQDLDGNLDRYGWDFISGDSRAYDDGYHGTQAASAVRLIAPHARILPVKIFNPWGITTSAAVFAGFKYATDRGARIILCPWATKVHSLAIEQGVAYARSRGVLVVTSAGDFGDRLSQTPAYPASLTQSFDNVLTVAGTDERDQLLHVDGHPASFDPGLVQIAAPAQNIWVAQPRNEFSIESSSHLAAALVAGAVARNLSHGDEGQTPAQWIEQLRNQADRVPSLQGAVKDGLRLRIR